VHAPPDAVRAAAAGGRHVQVLPMLSAVLPRVQAHAPPLACDFFCLNKCSPNKARDSGASYCRAACGLDSICDTPVKPAGK
jgi:hypothetical protein